MSPTKPVQYLKVPQSDVEAHREFKRSNVSITRSRNKYSKVVCNADVWAQRNLNSNLFGAIYDNNIDKVEKLLQQGANPNSTCRTFKFTAVHLAVLTACEDILNVLINKGAKVNAIDKGGLNPLHYAAYHNRAGCIVILLKHISEVEKDDFLNLRSETQCPVVLEYLKDSLDHTCGTYQNEFSMDIPAGSTPLHIASQKLNLKCVESLLEYHPDIYLTDERGLNAYNVIGEKLIEVENNSESNFIKIINLLKTKETTEEIEIACHYFTPLHAAVILSSVEGIHILMNDPNTSYSTFDHEGQTAIHLSIVKQLEVSLSTLLECVKDVSGIKNAVGITPFQAAVERQWIKGVGLLLNANANVAEIAADGRTVLHVAACSGNVEFLEELLELEQIETILDAQSNTGETPLYSAITSGCLECVETLLAEGVDISIKLNGNINILHRAAEYGYADILEALLRVADELKYNLIDEADTLTYSGMTPLHMAALNDNVDCVNELLNWQCDFRKKTTSNVYNGCLAIHLAAMRGHDKVVQAFLDHDKELIWEQDDKNRQPLHCAALYGQRDSIEVLLSAGADLSSIYDDESALDIIYRNISRPTEFLETVFDNAIIIDNKETLITDKNCMINIDFSILLPKDDNFNQMSILSNILCNGKGFEQRKLLLHPLIESFLYLKWNKMRTIFWLLLTLYALFVIVLTVFVVSLFYYQDENRPLLLRNIEVTRFIMVVLLSSVTVPEILLASQRPKQYSLNTDRAIKWTSIILVGVLMFSHQSNHQEKWLRHIATISILTSWIEMMFILSKVPTWGYYVQMFFKVSSNVIKVMTVFSFLVIGFALAFMIEFQATEPFNDPLSGIIKTIVMMTAELDYSGMFTGENKDNAQVINLTIYVVFLMLGTIVLMNLLVGLAVSDIHDLEIIGKIDRHSQQIDFLTILESDTFARFLPQKIKTRLVKGKCIQSTMNIYPSHPKCSIIKCLPPKLRESIIDIAENNFQKETEITNQHLNRKIDELMKIIEDINSRLPKN